MTELKPCPFCGGTNLKIKGGIGKYVICIDCDNGAHFPGRGSTANENDAIEAWNTRAERTCHPVPKYGDDSPWPVMVCSECGRGLHYDETKGSLEYSPYCVCGAKVVE